MTGAIVNVARKIINKVQMNGTVYKHNTAVAMNFKQRDFVPLQEFKNQNRTKV